MISVGAVITGCTIGAGVGLLIKEVARPVPALGPALRRLNHPAPPPPPGTLSTSRDERWGAFLVDHLSALRPVRIPYKNLALVGQSPGRFLLTKVALAAAGLLLPAVAGVPFLLLGVPNYLPVTVGLVFAGLLWFAPDLALRDQARRAREEFAHAMAAYLDLVALRRAGNTSAEQAMEQAAQVGKGWAFGRIQDALARSRVDKVPHWESLGRLTTELDLPILEDLAAIMRQSSDDGAAVYTTLRSRAKNLRNELLANQTTEANANSETMTAPGALLAVLIMLLIAFPAVVRILSA